MGIVETAEKQGFQVCLHCDAIVTGGRHFAAQDEPFTRCGPCDRKMYQGFAADPLPRNRQGAPFGNSSKAWQSHKEAMLRRFVGLAEMKLERHGYYHPHYSIGTRVAEARRILTGSSGF